MAGNSLLDWKHVFNSIKDSIVLLDTNGFIMDCNDSFIKLVNKSRTQIIDYECSKIIFDRTDRLKNCPFLRSKRSKQRESLIVEKNDRWFNVDVDPILYENQINGLVLFISDITEHRKTEKIIKKSEEKFRTLTENINVGIYRNTVGQKGKFIEANPAIVRMFGFKNREEFLAHNVSELYLQPDDRNKFNDEMLEKGFVKDKVLLLKQKDGTPFFGSISAVTIKDNEGNLKYYDGIIEDITKRKKAEKALWESEKKYKDLFEKSKDAILIIHNGKFVDCNRATVDMLKYNKKEDLLNTHPSKLSPEKQQDGEISFPKANEMMRIAFENGSHRFEWDHKKSNGEIFPVEVLLTSISSDEKNQIFHTVWRDITERKKTEKALEKEKKYYHSFVTSLSDWVWEMDMNGIHTYSNLAVESILGYKAEDVVGHHVKELWGEGETTAKSLKILHEALSTGKGWENVSGRFKHKNGSIIITESTANPIYDSKNKLIGYRGIDHDITVRKQAEEALKKQNLKYQTLLLNLDGMVYRCKNDKKWTMEFISAGCLSLTGYKSDDLLDNNKLSYNELILPEYQDSLWEKWQEKLKTRESVEVEYEIRTATGDIKWVWERGRGIFDKSDQLTHLEGLITDITERKHTEQIQEVIYNISNAAASTDDLEKMISLIHKELGTMIDTTNFYIALYDEKKEMFSLPFFTDAKDKDVTFPAGKTLTNYVRKTQKSLLANKKVKVELEKSGDFERFGVDSQVWLGVPLKIEGKITGVLAVQSYTDELAYTESDLKMLEFVSNQVSISIERKRIEIALKENEERFKQLVENATDIIYLLDANGYMTYVNPVTLKLGNYKEKDLIGINYLDIVHPDHYHDVKRFFRNQFIKKIKNTYKEFPIKTKEGSYVWLGQNVQLLLERNKIVGYQAIARDISKRRLAEEALRKEKEKAQQYLSIAGVMFVAVDKKGIVSLVNKKTCEILGYEENEIIGKNWFENFIPERIKDTLISISQKLLSDNIESSKYNENYILTKGNKEKLILWQNIVIKDSKGNIAGHLSSGLDITEKKRAEEDLRNSRERLKMLNKIIRHDISNDFIVIKSAINIFKRTSDATMMNEIEKRVDKSLTAIDSYRKYESFIDINQDLEELEITELLNELIVEFPKIKFNIHGNCKVFADETINSVFTNLITNSIKHGKASKIDVKISTENSKCEIKFIDNGTGIPDKIIDKIFDEGFFHGKAGHTGIGLHIVRRTIENYGGSIFVENNKPNGAVFTINLKKVL